MAPELLQERPYNKSIDCYAFGIVLWEIFSRAVPFSGYEAVDIREAVVSGGRPKVKLSIVFLGCISSATPSNVCVFSKEGAVNTVIFVVYCGLYKPHFSSRRNFPLRSLD